ncbi:MAG: hypothetical protein M3Q81_02490 [bacterium]|nr:hypothetical protein [bacterium]
MTNNPKLINAKRSHLIALLIVFSFLLSGTLLVEGWMNQQADQQVLGVEDDE